LIDFPLFLSCISFFISTYFYSLLAISPPLQTTRSQAYLSRITDLDQANVSLSENLKAKSNALQQFMEENKKLATRTNQSENELRNYANTAAEYESFYQKELEKVSGEGLGIWYVKLKKNDCRMYCVRNIDTFSFEM
jgi:DNA repair exonuclease SbcCD ATPase subunit